MHASPRLSSLGFLVGAFLVTVTILSVVGAIGMGITGLLQ